MLPRKNRISVKDFPAHKVQGFRAFSPFFSAVFYPLKREGSKESHAAIVVSKKTAKTAVARNLLRRRFYELLAPYFKDFSAVTTIVVYPKAEAQKAEFAVLRSEIEKALKQARLVK